MVELGKDNLHTERVRKTKARMNRHEGRYSHSACPVACLIALLPTKFSENPPRPWSITHARCIGSSLTDTAEFGAMRLLYPYYILKSLTSSETAHAQCMIDTTGLLAP